MARVTPRTQPPQVMFWMWNVCMGQLLLVCVRLSWTKRAGMKRPETGHYELAISYRSDDELDKTVHDLLTEISQEADMRNCFIEADAWEEGTERRW